MTDSEPIFGEPTEDLPEPGRRGYEIYWQKVGEHVRANPYKWIEIVNPPTSIGRLTAIGTLLSNRNDIARIPMGIRQPGFSSRIRQRQFWMRYEPPAKAQQIRRIG
jgi:hypothetical protein